MKSIYRTLLGLLLLAGAAWGLFMAHESTPVTPPGFGASSALKSASSSSDCSLGLHAYYNEKYDYQFCVPHDWKVDLGSPPDPAHLALGPEADFRPLILISVFKKSELKEHQDLLLADTVILQRKARTIAGIRTEQITVRAVQGTTEQLVFFQRGENGFSMVELEGLEEEHVDQVFDQILASFSFPMPKSQE